MRRTMIFTAAMALVASAVLAGCGEDEPATGAGTQSASADEIRTSDSDLGTILVDGEGRTLYLFTQDSPGTSVCEAECLDAWPPVEGEVSAGEGVDAGLIGTIERSDGSTQASYGDWPLYYFAEDTEAGDVNGQGVNDVWYVIGPDGEAVKKAPDTGMGGGGGGY